MYSKLSALFIGTVFFIQSAFAYGVPTQAKFDTNVIVEKSISYERYLVLHPGDSIAIAFKEEDPKRKSEKRPYYIFTNSTVDDVFVSAPNRNQGFRYRAVEDSAVRAGYMHIRNEKKPVLYRVTKFVHFSANGEETDSVATLPFTFTEYQKSLQTFKNENFDFRGMNVWEIYEKLKELIPDSVLLQSTGLGISIPTSSPVYTESIPAFVENTIHQAGKQLARIKIPPSVSVSVLEGVTLVLAAMVFYGTVIYEIGDAFHMPNRCDPCDFNFGTMVFSAGAISYAYHQTLMEAFKRMPWESLGSSADRMYSDINKIMPDFPQFEKPESPKDWAKLLEKILRILRNPTYQRIGLGLSAPFAIDELLGHAQRIEAWLQRYRELDQSLSLSADQVRFLHHLDLISNLGNILLANNKYIIQSAFEKLFSLSRNETSREMFDPLISSESFKSMFIRQAQQEGNKKRLTDFLNRIILADAIYNSENQNRNENLNLIDMLFQIQNGRFSRQLTDSEIQSAILHLKNLFMSAVNKKMLQDFFESNVDSFRVDRSFLPAGEPIKLNQIATRK
ncbi:MAG: hypothetical protein R3A45_01300 [Bdellovibrionota bacterium]